MTEIKSSSAALHEALNALVRLLERQHIPYMVIGGLAMAVWGRLRATQDVDLAIALSESAVPDFLELLQEAHFLPSSARNLPGHKLLVCRYLKPTKGLPVQVDILFPRGEYQQQALARAVTIRLGNRPLQVIAPEDLILFKLLAARPIDELDIQTILEEQRGKLDRKYLNGWVKRLKLSSKLKNLRPRG